MNKLIEGPAVSYELLLTDNVLGGKPVYIENFRSAKEFVKRSENLNDYSIAYEPDMLLPLPTANKLSIDDFLAPFPFIVEMPMLNLEEGIKDSLPVMLSEIDQCEPNNLKVV